MKARSSFKWTYVFVATVAALAAFTIYDFKQSEKRSATEDQNERVMRLPIEDLVHIAIASSSSTLTLDKKDGQWRLTAPMQDLADTQAMQTFTMSLNGEKITQTVAEGADVKLETYGLKDPVKRLNVGTKDGKTEEIKIGSVKAYDNNVYAQIAGENKVLLVNANWDVLLSKLAKDFRDKHLLRADVALKDLKQIEIRQPGSDLFLAKDGEHWHVKSGGVTFPLADEHVAFFLDALKGVRLQDFAVPDKKAAGEIAKHGLEKPNVEIKLFKDPAAAFFTLSIAAPEKVKQGSGVAPSAFAVSTDLNDIVSVTKSVTDTVRKTAQDFYDKRQPFQFTIADVARIEVQTPELKAGFSKKGEVWTLEATEGNLQKNIDGAKLTQALDRLNHMEAIRVLSSLPKGQASPALKGASHLILQKAAGEPVFVFEWGKPVVEKATLESPEARYLPARTDHADALIGVTEGEVQKLEIGSWLQPAPVASPVVAPTPSK